MSANKIELPLRAAKSFDGIIAHLTCKYGGNVHDIGIITIAAKSVLGHDPRNAVRNVADITSDSQFLSGSEPDQWICWDFHESRVRPTHYTIRSGGLRSWVVESSLDGEAWIEIDRQENNVDFKSNVQTVSFAVLSSAESRFIRLTQLSTNHSGDNQLSIGAFELFGTFLESGPRAPVSVATPAPAAPHLQSGNLVEIPLTAAKSLDGIISHLTRKSGGNVHDIGLVTITSKSVGSSDPMNAVRNIAAITSDARFISANSAGQWICWDFHKKRVRPTNYAIRGSYLKSWVLESSLDGSAWAELDRKVDNQDLSGDGTASFVVPKSLESRFIRLTQTGKNHQGSDALIIDAFEFFGSLLE
jgi:hypothetical protein